MINRPESALIDGPAGAIEVVLEVPERPSVGLAVVAHPLPIMGGTMDNKVVHTMARALVLEGWVAVRFNFRGVGRSEGAWDEGRGEIDDMLAVLAQHRIDPAWRHLPVALAGFSFGGYVAASAAQRLVEQGQALQALALVSPAARFGLPTVPTHTLVVQGEVDDVVPLSGLMDWARPQGLPITVVPGAGHFFHGQLGTLRQIVRQYLVAHAPRPPA